MSSEDSKQWSSKPFVAYDGGDGQGGSPAELLVIKGAGTVSKIDNKGKTAQVNMKVEGRKYDITGWINTDEEAFQIASEAYKTGDTIQFRSEIQRKPAEPRETPIAELRELNGRPDSATALEHTRKLMVGFAPLGQPLVLAAQHRSLPQNDPSTGESVPATANTPNPSYSSYAQAEASDIESKPWLGVNNDGSLNAGSYAINAETTMYFVIRSRFPEASEESIREASSELLHAVDKMQVGIYRGSLKKPNRFYDSHLMGRKIVQELLAGDIRVEDAEHHVRNEFIDDKDKRHAWFKIIVKQAFSIWEWALEDYKSTI
jgi:hypothetical protein